jgi:hypothetical protein
MDKKNCCDKLSFEVCANNCFEMEVKLSGKKKSSLINQLS